MRVARTVAVDDATLVDQAIAVTALGLVDGLQARQQGQWRRERLLVARAWHLLFSTLYSRSWRPKLWFLGPVLRHTCHKGEPALVRPLDGLVPTAAEWCNSHRGNVFSKGEATRRGALRMDEPEWN